MLSRNVVKRRLVGPYVRSGNFGVETKSLSQLGIYPCLLGRPARSVVSILTEVSGLLLMCGGTSGTKKIMFSCVGLRIIHSFIQQSVLRQVQSLFQIELSTQCDLELPPSNENILSFP